MSCGGDPTAPVVPTSLALSTQTLTFDAIGATWSIAPTVLDQNGVVIAHPAVTWTSSDARVASVNASGVTTALANGTTIISAKVAALSSTVSVTVSQIAVAAQKVSGDQQSGAAGSELAQPVKIKVVDRLGHAIEGKPVTFAVTQGGGNAVTPNVASGADGTASTAWTLGTSAPASNQVTATVAGVSDAATFTATAVAGPTVGITFGASLPIVDEGGSAAVTVSTRDRFGNPIATSGVTMVSRNPAVASITPSGTMTGIARGQTTIVATTTGSAPITDSVVAVVRAPGGPVLRSSLISFSLDHDTTVTVSVFVDFGPSITRAASTRITVAWDPAVLHYVSSAAGANPAAVINAATGASGSLTLAYADAFGFTGNVEVARVTFRTASTPGASGQLTVTASELSGNDFADLAANLVQVVQRIVIH